jgi:hypothetical protein
MSFDVRPHHARLLSGTKRKYVPSLVNLLTWLLMLRPGRPSAFGIREGKKVLLSSEERSLLNGTLPREAVWRNEEVFTHFEHLPDVYPEPDPSWSEDCRIFQEQVKALQSSCEAPCVVREIEEDGIGSTLIRMIIGPQDAWAGNNRVLFASSKQWAWSKADTALKCNTLFGCYLAPITTCNAIGSEETLHVDPSEGFFVKSKHISSTSGWPGKYELTNPEQWHFVRDCINGECHGYQMESDSKNVVLQMGAHICWHSDSYRKHAHPLFTGVTRSSRDHWHFQKWGIMRSEAALVDLVYRLSTPFQKIVDKTLNGLGMQPKDNACIAMHVRHGKLECFCPAVPNGAPYIVADRRFLLWRRESMCEVL